MKTIRNFLISIFILIGFIYIIVYLDSKDRSLSNGYYIDYSSWSSIILDRDQNVFIGGILKYAYDNEYIIAQRFPRIHYSCSNYIDSYFIKNKQYLIIDSKKDIVFGGFNFRDFVKKKEELNINLKFGNGKSKTMRHIKWSDYIEKEEKINYMKKFCKKNKEYPIVNKF